MLGGKLCDGKSIDVQVINCYYSGIDDVMNDAIENISQAGMCIYMSIIYVTRYYWIFICTVDFDFQPDCNGT